MSEESLLPAIVLLPLLGAVLPYAFARLGRPHAAWACAAVMAGSLALLVPLLGHVFAGGTWVVAFAWLPQWGIDLSFRLDGLGMLFALLILGIGLLVVLYAAYYMPESDRLGRLLALLLLFMGAMLGIVLAENVLLLLVFWELTSLASFLLIAYKHGQHEARIAARMALAVTGGGGLALLGGLLLLGRIAGSFELSVILAQGGAIRADPLFVPMLLLVLLGAFTKSAQFPFHFWLPNAMAAPTPVSAYLHSATMVKAGVFLLARLYPVLSGNDVWFYVVSAVGGTTLVYTAYIALLKHDLKGLLAYSTTSHLGLITLLFGLDTPLSAVAGVFHVINHAVFKASLFMAAGIVDHECGTRDMRRINGMARYMPITATLAIVAAGSMAGVPLLNGFLSKEMFFAETVDHPPLLGQTSLLPLFATAAGMLSVAYSARFIHDVFFHGEPVDLPRTPHEPPRWMRAPVEVLVALCVLVGVFPQATVGPLLAVAAGSTLQALLPEYSLALWHGFGLPVMMSIAALVLGVVFYIVRQTVGRLHERYVPDVWTRTAFERFYRALSRVAAAFTRAVDDGSTQRYVLLLVVTTLVLGAWAFGSAPPAPAVQGLATPADPLSIGGLLALAAGALGATVRHRERLLALILVGVVGLVVSLAFVRLSAPDLALTQLSVEVVTIVLMLLALYYLPQFTPGEDTRGRVVRDATIAVAGGAGIAALAHTMLTRPLETISGYYLDEAVPGGGGTNVVNVILVDFRGFDTLGEITVLGIAALGVHALLQRLRLVRPARDAWQRPWSPDAHPLFLEMLVRPLLPLAIVVSVYILLRGHNLPGGGFIAGLVTAVALILQYLGSGIEFAHARLPLRYTALLAAGLGLATATGAGSMLLGHAFLTSAVVHVSLPWGGELELVSAMLFDIGVYLVVVTAVLMILAELGRVGGRALEEDAR